MLQKLFFIKLQQTQWNYKLQDCGVFEECNVIASEISWLRKITLDCIWIFRMKTWKKAFPYFACLWADFLKLINNSKAKDKGNHALWRVWISDEKLLVFASLISPSKSVCLRSYIKHLSQCFITISKTSKFVKKLYSATGSTRRFFNSLLGVWYVMKHCVSRLIYYMKAAANAHIFGVVLQICRNTVLPRSSQKAISRFLHFLSTDFGL